jgi:phage gp36-like protein
MAYSGYCVSAAEVIRFLGKVVTVGEGVSDTIKDSADLEKYMTDADEVIDSILGECYYVPLLKIKVGGADVYPEPISYAAKVFAASNIISIFLKDVNPAESTAVQKMKEETIFRLQSLVSGQLAFGSSRLRGQKLKPRNKFVSPGIAPSSPGTPSAGAGGGLGIG